MGVTPSGRPEAALKLRALKRRIVFMTFRNTPWLVNFGRICVRKRLMEVPLSNPFYPVEPSLKTELITVAKCE